MTETSWIVIGACVVAIVVALVLGRRLGFIKFTLFGTLGSRRDKSELRLRPTIPTLAKPMLRPEIAAWRQRITPAPERTLTWPAGPDEYKMSGLQHASADYSSAGRDINVTAGLTEETRNLIAGLLGDKENQEFARCADHYFAALAGYCAP